MEQETKALRTLGDSSDLEEEMVVAKQTPGVMPGERERGSFPSQGREGAWVSLASWIWGRRTERMWRASADSVSTDCSCSQQPARGRGDERERERERERGRGGIACS